MKHIYIMSSERSGSNLLRKILGAHPDLLSPPAVHFAKNLAGLSGFYGEGEQFRAEELLSDLCKVAESHIIPWETKLDLEEIKGNLQGETFWHCVTALFDSYAITEKKSGWVCKDNELFNYAAEIIACQPKAKFIYMIRDCRDVGLSFRNAPSGPISMTYNAYLWTKQQQQCMRLAQVYSDNIMTIRYEDLITNSESTLKGICKHIEVDYCDEMLGFYKSDNNESQSSTFWQNLNEPIIKGNTTKWRRELSKAENDYLLNLQSGQLASILKKYGYSTENQGVSRHYKIYRMSIDLIRELAIQGFRKIFPPEIDKRHEKKRVLREISQRVINFE